MENTKSVADVLERAAELIELGGWCQGWYAKDADGNPLYLSEGDICAAVNSPRACRFCLIGAIQKASGQGRNSNLRYQAVRQLDLRMAAADWNDARERTQAEVVAKLREAAALARAEAIQ